MLTIFIRSHAEDAMTGDATMDKALWKEQGLDRNGFVLIFGLITIATIVVALIRAFAFFSLCMRSSIKSVPTISSSTFDLWLGIKWLLIFL